VNWIDAKSKVKPQIGRVIICYCPEWSDSGYQVAEWNGREFTYADQSNDMFNDCVVSWSVFMEAD
jgi:hypothetical protein